MKLTHPTIGCSFLLLTGCGGETPVPPATGGELPKISIVAGPAAGKANASAAVVERNAGMEPPAIFSIVLDQPSASVVTVDFSTVADSAAVAVDFIASSGRIRFEPGERQVNLTTAVVGDNLFELDERFRVALSDPVNAVLGDADAYAMILDDDPPPRATLETTLGRETDGGNPKLTFRVKLSPPSGASATVVVATDPGGTAQAGVDYQPKQESLQFAPGETLKYFRVPIMPDDLDEPTETVAASITSVVNAAIGNPSSGLGAIRDDDPPPPNHTLTPELGFVSVEYGTVADVETYVIYVAPDAALTPANYASLGGRRIVFPASPASVSIPTTGAWWFRMAAVRNGIEGEPSPTSSVFVTAPVTARVLSAAGDNLFTLSAGGLRVGLGNGRGSFDLESGAADSAVSFPRNFSDDGVWAVFLRQEHCTDPNSINNGKLRGRIILEHVPTGTEQEVSNNPCLDFASPTISGDGAVVLFTSNVQPSYRYDRLAGTLSAPACRNFSSGTSVSCSLATVARNGARVAARASGTGVTLEDTFAGQDAFLFDWDAGTVTMASKRTNGTPLGQAVQTDLRLSAFADSVGFKHSDVTFVRRLGPASLHTLPRETTTYSFSPNGRFVAYSQAGEGLFAYDTLTDTELRVSSRCDGSALVQFDPLVYIANDSTVLFRSSDANVACDYAGAANTIYWKGPVFSP